MNARNSVGEEPIVQWESIANDLSLEINPEFATGAGELLVEFPSGARVRMGAKMKIADVRDCPVKIKCSALSAAQDDLYLLAFLNPDVPSAEKPVQRYQSTIITVTICRLAARGKKLRASL